MIDPALLREAEAIAHGADLPKIHPTPKPKKPKDTSIGKALLKALEKKGLLPKESRKTTTQGTIK